MVKKHGFRYSEWNLESPNPKNKGLEFDLLTTATIKKYLIVRNNEVLTKKAAIRNFWVVRKMLTG